MKGVIIRKAKVVSDDSRRSITEIMNGELGVRNLKILKVKKGEQILGNHWHTYSEVMYILKGSGHYHMNNLDTGENIEIDLEEGDTIFRTGRIIHGGYFKEGTIIIDAACESYVDADFNDVIGKVIE